MSTKITGYDWAGMRKYKYDVSEKAPDGEMIRTKRKGYMSQEGCLRSADLVSNAIKEGIFYNRMTRKKSNENKEGEMSIYKCSMCKKDLTGPAALVNAAGRFCEECFDVIKKRISDSKIEWDGRCPWCGSIINESNKYTSGAGDAHVCKTCSMNRSWLLSCIRHSDRPAKYTARIEDREAPNRAKRELKLKEEREERARIIAAKPVQEKLPMPTDTHLRAAMTPDDIAKVVAAVMNELLK